MRASFKLLAVPAAAVLPTLIHIGLVMLALLQTLRYLAGSLSAIWDIGQSHSAPRTDPRLYTPRQAQAAMHRFAMQTSAALAWNLGLLISYQLLTPWGRQALMPFSICLALIIIASQLGQRVISDVFGDVPAYVNYSEFTQHHRVQREIKAKGTAVLTAALREYDRVVLVGHSLGSVIARDLCREVWLYHREVEVDGVTQDLFAKLHALVTIGSPIRKLKGLVEGDEPGRGGGAPLSSPLNEEIFAAPPGWERPASVVLGTASDRIRLDTPPAPRGYLPWYNFWILTDLVSDPLRDRFPVTYERQIPWGWRSVYWSHSDYFKARLFYDMMLDMLEADPGEGIAKATAAM